MPSLEQWQEWGAQCAAARCAPETRAALHLFGWQRFGHYARRARGEGVAGCLPDAAGCWHLLEARLVTGRSRPGKAYKRWLFDRTAGGGEPLDAVQGGASLLLRSVVRDFLRREAPRPATVSLDAPLEGVEGRLTLADLLPAPDATGAEPDAPRLAGAIARAAFDALDVRARLLVLAKHLDLPLYHPAVTAAAGTSRSRASEIWREAFERLAAEARRACPDEDAGGRLRLCLLAAPELARLIFQWARAEKSAAPVFRVAEEQA
jgi:hypothetical protein